jgi:putative transposase
MDWRSRKVLAWRLSNTMDAQFCIDVLDEALERYGPPKIFNTPSRDIALQYPAGQRTRAVSSRRGLVEQRLKDAGVRISMDGRGRYLDNIFIERLWRSLKYECVYLHAFSGGAGAPRGIQAWIAFYNDRRPHADHGGGTPGSIYRNALSASGPGLRPDLHPTAQAA